MQKLPNRFQQLIPKNEITDALKKFKRVFYTVGVFTAVINLLMLAPSIYMLEVYDRVLASQNEYTLYMLTLLILGLFALINLLEQMRTMVVIRVGSKMDDFLNQRIFTAAFEQNLKKSGINAGQALNDLTTIRQFVTGNGLFAFFDAPWFPIYLLIIFMFNFWLGLFSTISVAILVTLAWLNEAVSKNPLSEANTIAVRSGAMATNNLRNAEVIEAMGMLGNMRRRWYENHKNFLSAQSLASERSSQVTAVSKFVRLSVQSLILGLAALLVIRGEVTAGMMIAASILLGRALSPVEQVIAVSRQWRGTVIAYERLRDLLADNPLRVNSMKLPTPTGKVSVEGITAAPPGSNVPVVAQLTFAINAGDVLGIIGPSGSGKSTLARLLVGVWPALAGKVRLDGADIYQWNKEELGPSMGYLPQDVELFAGTISENIARFGDVDPEKVVKAAQLSGVHDLILHLPKGYDTVIGDGGAGLSGGQKQRIGLARALYDLPALIVLDEPNSNLDDAGEAALTQSIIQLQKMGKTVILISHRPNIIKITNKLLVLRDGINQAFGPTDQVLQLLAKKQSEAQAAQAAATKTNQAAPTSITTVPASAVKEVPSDKPLKGADEMNQAEPKKIPDSDRGDKS
jgi:ATP-binding cassette subfamily C exporter for protease/lipase